MKTFTTSAALAALIASADAFPHMAAKMAMELQKRQSVPAIPLDSSDFTGAPTTVFNAQDQLLDISGDHAYTAPDFDAGDIRGPCPGLNALANHNFIAHNGVTNLEEAIAGTATGFNMGADLGGFLSAYSVIMDGDLLTQQWSIGGAPSGSASLGGLLSAPQGLTGSHNKYESDSSPMRGDLYEYCNNYEIVMTQYQEFYDYHKGEADDEVTYSFEDFSKFRGARFEESVAQNPNFFYGPFSGLIVSQAAFTFIPAFMSNHSAEYPNGILSRQTMNAIMGVTETGGTGKGDGTLTYNPGTERFPENWYRRSSTNPYTIAAFANDAVRVLSSNPAATAIGGNTNGVNTFSGVDLGNITAGVYETQNLASSGTTLQCFAFQLLQQSVLDEAKGLTSTLVSAVNSLVSQYITPATVGCPTLANVDETAFTSDYPGAPPSSNGQSCNVPAT